MPSGSNAVSAPSTSQEFMAELFDDMTSADVLYAAFQKSKKGSSWKGSVQHYEMNLLSNILKTRDALRTKAYEQKPFVCFELHERGKTRFIKSMHIFDRVVQRSLCEEVLAPSLNHLLIHDNGASIEGKGIDFTRRRLDCHLEKFLRRHGVNGYILKVDFSKFFDNIDHELALKAVAKHIDDPAAMELIAKLVGGFRIDVSDLSDKEIKRFEDAPFDALKHKLCDRGEKFLCRSFGIGSQISQIVGIYYPTPIDFYCKTKRACKYYGRYMDDIYIIHEDKEFLKDVLEGIKAEAKALKLFINPKKTTITPLKSGFTFMKIKYRFTSTGKIIRCLSRDSFTRERRRLKKYRRLFDEGRVTRRDVCNFYQSFRGSAKKFMTHRSLMRMDALYNQLFVEN